MKQELDKASMALLQLYYEETLDGCSGGATVGRDGRGCGPTGDDLRGQGIGGERGGNVVERDVCLATFV
jgi:hypothetical protein